MLNRKVFSMGTGRLSNFFKKEAVSDLFLEDYYNAIKNLNDNQFNRAVEYLIKNHNSHFFPIPQEFLKAVQETREIAQPTPITHRIEPDYKGCPPEVKKQIQETMERIKKRGMNV